MDIKIIYNIKWTYENRRWYIEWDIPKNLEDRILENYYIYIYNNYSNNKCNIIISNEPHHYPDSKLPPIKLEKILSKKDLGNWEIHTDITENDIEEIIKKIEKSLDK